MTWQGKETTLLVCSILRRPGGVIYLLNVDGGTAEVTSLLSASGHSFPPSDGETENDMSWRVQFSVSRRKHAIEQTMDISSSMRKHRRLSFALGFVLFSRLALCTS